jgi:transposase
MIELRENLIKRPAKKIPQTKQKLFAFERSEATKKRITTKNPSFINKNSDDIFIGDVPLRKYLKNTGMSWVLSLRDILQSSDMTAFIKKYQTRGRKAIHPQTILGLIVYGILMRQSSLRELEGLANRDIGAWWICGGLRPDHSTIGKFITLHSETLSEDYFTTLTKELITKLKIKPSDCAADGTVIEAASSRYKLIKAEAAHIASEKAKREARAEPENKNLQLKAKETEKASKIARHRQEKRIAVGNSPDKTIILPKEPEAATQRLKNGTYRPSYQPSVLVDKSRLIVGKHVDPSNENVAIKPMLDQYKEFHNALPQCIMLDAGYHSSFILRLLVELDVDVLCPQGRVDRDNEWKKKPKNKLFDKSNFEYDEKRNIYICPEKQELPFMRNLRSQGEPSVQYRGRACLECPSRDKCTKSKVGRTIRRYEADPLKEGMLEVFKDKKARKKYRQRKAIVEPVFAEIKERQGLTRFRTCGLKKVKTEFSLHCIAYNLKRAISLGGGLYLFIFYYQQTTASNSNEKKQNYVFAALFYFN